MFQPLTGLYEPSSIQQLADGRFLVVEDKKSDPFSLVTISAAGDVSSTPLLPPAGDDAAGKLDDLEALAPDRAEYVYALTSHSRNAKGNGNKVRDKLVRFRSPLLEQRAIIACVENPAAIFERCKPKG